MCAIWRLESGKILELSDCSLITLRQTVVSVSYLTALLKLMGGRHHRAELFYHNYPTYQTPQTANRYVEKLAYNPNYNQTPPNTTQTKNTTQKTTTRRCCARKNRTTTTKERKYSLKKQEFQSKAILVSRK
jgi:hypothetical protein